MRRSDLVYGFHPVREALRGRAGGVQEVLIASGRGGRRRAEIARLCERHGVQVREVPEEELSALSGGASHNGFAARLSARMEDRPGGDPDLVVLVEDVQDPRNLGALLRVCEGAGASRVLIRDRGSAPLSATTLRTAAGAAEWLRIERVTNSAATIEQLQSEGFWVYGTAAGGTAPWEVDLSARVALVFGGEERGLRRLTRERCDGVIGLPMRGRVASLNLATAAAAVLFEAVRQRMALPPGRLEA